MVNDSVWKLKEQYPVQVPGTITSQKITFKPQSSSVKQETHFQSNGLCPTTAKQQHFSIANLVA